MEGAATSQNGQRGDGKRRRRQRAPASRLRRQIDLHEGQSVTQRGDDERNRVEGLADASYGHGGERGKRIGGERTCEKTFAVEGIDPAAPRRADCEDAERAEREEMDGDSGEIAESGGERDGLDLEGRAGEKTNSEIGIAEAEEFELSHIGDEEKTRLVVFEESRTVRVATSFEVNASQRLESGRKRQRSGTHHFPRVCVHQIHRLGQLVLLRFAQPNQLDAVVELHRKNHRRATWSRQCDGCVATTGQ